MSTKEKKPIMEAWFGGYGTHQHPVMFFREKSSKRHVEYFFREDAKEILNHLEKLSANGWDVRVVNKP